MRRAARVAMVCILAVGVMGLPFSTLPANAAPEQVDGLKGSIGGMGQGVDGLAELTDWLGSLEAEQAFGDRLPLLETTLGEALNLADAFGAIKTAINGVSAPDVAGLASGLDGLDGPYGTPAVTAAFGTSNVDDTGPIYGLDLTVNLTRTISAAELRVVAPATGSTPEVVLRSTGGAGVPLTVTFDGVFSLRYDVDTDQFWLTEGDGGSPSNEADDTPRFTASAVVSSFTFPSSGFTSAIGVGDINILDTSTFDLNASFFGDINDSNTDNELAFREPGNPGELLPAELRLPRSQNVEVIRSGDVSTSLDLDSPLLSGSEDAHVDVPAAADNLVGADPIPTVSGSDIAELAQFENVAPVDLVAGLVQYATMLRALQSNPNVDFELPLLSGRLSDVVHVEEDVASFADDRVNDGITPDTPIEEMVDFETILDLVDKMENGPDALSNLQDTNEGDTGKLTPAYDTSSNLLTFDLHIKKTAGTFEPFPALPAETPAELASEKGIPDIGDTLKEFTGLRAVSARRTSGGDPTTSPERKVEYELRMPFVIDLQNATPVGDDTTTEGIVEFENPMVHQRFRTSTSNDNDITLSGIVQTPIEADGQIGFVGVNIGGAGPLASTYTMDKKGMDTPMLVVDVDASNDSALGSQDVRIYDLLRNLIDDEDDAGEPDTSNDPVEPAQPDAKVDSVLKVEAPGPGGHANDVYSLTESPGTITIAWPDIDTALASGDVTLDGSAELLKKLDIVPNGAPEALLGKLLDKTTNVAEGIESGIETLGGSGGLLNEKIPFLGSSASELFEAGRTLVQEIEDFRTSPSPVTLQDLETKFQEKLGAALGIGSAATKANILRFSLKNFDGGEPELVVRLGFDEAGSQQKPLGIDLGFGDIVGITGSGSPAIDTGSKLALGIPITLEAPSGDDLTAPDPKILTSSGFELSAEIADQAGTTALQANLGPLSIALGKNPGPGRYQFGAKFTAYPSGTPVPEGSEASQSLSAFLGSLSPNVGGAAGSPYDCLPPDDDADGGTSAPDIEDAVLGCAALPVYLNNNPISGDVDTSYVTVKVDDLTSVPAITFPSDLETSFLNNLFSFASLGDGLDKLNAILDLAVQGATFGSKIPLIGDELQAGADIITKVQSFVKDPLASLGVVPADVTVEWVDDHVRKPLATALTGQGLLREAGYVPTSPNEVGETGAETTTPGFHDIRLVMFCDTAPRRVCDRDDPTTVDDGDDTNGDENEAEPITSLKEVTLEFEMGQGSRDPGQGACDPGVDPGALPCPGEVDVPIDFGLPGLNLKATQPVKAEAGWNLQLGFGVSRDGFFVLDNPRPAHGAADDGDADAGPELKVGAGIGLQQDAGNPELKGKIGFLDIEMEDTPGGSDTHESAVTSKLVSNLMAPSGSAVCDPPGTPDENCSKRIGLGDLPGFSVKTNLAPVLSADADIDLQVTTGLSAFSSDSNDITKKLPKLRGDFEFNWAWTSEDPGNFGFPTVKMLNVGVDAGPLFSSTLQPIFNGLKRFTDPLKPIREFIFAPIPVISDISRLFGGGDVTYVDLAEIFGDVDLSLLEDIDALLDFLDTITALSATNGTFIPIGDGFEIKGERAVGAAVTPDQAKDLIKEADDELNGTGSILDLAKGEITESSKAQELTDLSDGGDISIPILEKPGCMFNLFVGGDCDLFLYSPDPFEIRFDYEQPFGPFFGVLYVTVGGFAGARGRISVGYDTKGLREMIQRIDAGDPLAAGEVVEGLLEGVFLGDLDEAGNDVAEFEVFAGITAGAKLSVVVAEAGARGGIEATVGLNLHDGPVIDGKLRISEIRSKIALPFCLFDVEGRLEAFLEVYLTLGVCPFCAEFDYELARVVLLDFSEGFCPETPPDLASSSGGVVTLNVGDDADQRGTGWGNSDVGPDENFVVRQIGDAGGGNKRFSITAFGYTEEEVGSSILINDAADGKDVFLFQGLKTGGASQTDTAATPGAIADFTAPVIAKSLGDDADAITTGVGNDQIDGGPGNDTINAGAGNNGVNDGDVTNDINGGSGNDTIVTGDGADVIRGNEDNDTIDAGLGIDRVDGGSGADRIIGGTDIIVKSGQSTPCPATPCDRFDEGDILTGGPGKDTIDGGSGNDTIHGDEALSDDSDGAAPSAAGDNDDKITGGLGTDTVFAGSGNDVVNGGADDSSLVTDQSRDKLHGNGGDDELFGALGNDNLWGGNGDDELRTGPGHDNAFGQGNNDDIFGEGGNDDLYGGGGADNVFGGIGDDDIAGGLGEDELFGDAGADVMMGDDGGIDDGNDDDPGNDDDSANTPRTTTPSEDTGDADEMFGGPDVDKMFGEGGTDEMHGGTGADVMHGNGNVDEMFGDNADDEMFGDGGNDDMQGGPDADLMFGNAGQDNMQGQTGADRMIGGNSNENDDDAGAPVTNAGDTMYGGTEADTMIGDNGTISSPPSLGATGLTGTFGNDTMNGGPGEDLMYGQEGDDLMRGAQDYDQMFGNLGADEMYGESGHDYMLGDSGTIEPTPGASPSTYPSNTAPVGAVINDVVLGITGDADEGPNDGGIDTMDGGSGDDHMWGGAKNDIMSGGFDDDYMEGNNGKDSMYGLSTTADDGIDQPSDLFNGLDGEDDMIGGSSPVNPLTDTPAGADDEGETAMQGNGQEDVMTGDNAIIDRLTTAGGTLWAPDNITGGRAREVILLDTEKTGAALEVVSGNDTILGNDQNDRIYGEGGNDCAKGNADEDYVEGNQDRDFLEGNGAQDDIVGGTSYEPVNADGTGGLQPAEGQPDDGDYLHGGAAADVITGDNAIITRDPAVPGPPYNYVTDLIEIPTARSVRLLDLASLNADAAGPDQISGGAGSDVAFGQDEGDFISGGSENDYMEGNGDTDFLWGDILLAEVGTPPQLPTGIPAVIADLVGCASAEPALSGTQGDHGQDDQIGGSTVKEHRDAGDFLFGNGAQDFQIGDNGEIRKKFTTPAKDTYLTFEDANPDTFVRQAVRFDVGGPVGAFGDDYFEGNDGDDYQWGQDGDDEMHGNDDNDDMFGELGDDQMFGEGGEDAMLGDRGVIVDDLIEAGDPDDPSQFTLTFNQPPFLTYTAFRPGTLDRRFDQLADGDGDVDGDGDPVEKPGQTHGGNDFMRGGPDHDSMHGSFGDDLMNGDDWGDILYGDDGTDVMWGGRGNPDPNGDPDLRGDNDEWVDYLFGGHGGDPAGDQGVITGGADIIDFRPRPGPDPANPAAGSPDPLIWFEITSTDDDTGAPGDILNNSHHQGVDWHYGGWDRDVMQGDITANGPNDGDKMLDWTGAFNLYTACNPAYGGANDIRAQSPQMLDFLERFAFSTGVGASLADVRDANSSAYRELALVYKPDLKDNAGKAYPTTPGHFDQISCTP